jgi:hypothetical protein
MPIGAAIGYAGTFVKGNREILARSAFKVVVYRELVPSRSQTAGPIVRIDRSPVPVQLLTDLSAEVAREYEAIKPRIIGAALTRRMARAVAAEGSRAAGKAVARPVLGRLVALAAKGALVGIDKPDTRSWTLLPQRVLASRMRVEGGQHRINLELQGVTRGQRDLVVEVPGGSYSVVVTSPR